jgi:hypothetical protein
MHTRKKWRQNNHFVCTQKRSQNCYLKRTEIEIIFIVAKKGRHRGSYSQRWLVYAHALALVCTFSLVEYASEPPTPLLSSHFLIDSQLLSLEKSSNCEHLRIHYLRVSHWNFKMKKGNSIQRAKNTKGHFSPIVEAVHPLSLQCVLLFTSMACQAWMEQNKEQVIVYKWGIDLRLEGVQYRMLAVRLVRLKASRNPILIQLACVFNSRLPLVLTPFTALWKWHKIIASRKKEEQQMLNFKPPKMQP